jgi:hypothetical protein
MLSIRGINGAPPILCLGRVSARAENRAPLSHRAFESLNFLRDLGKRIRKKIANEKDLERFLHNSVERLGRNE